MIPNPTSSKPCLRPALSEDIQSPLTSFRFDCETALIPYSECACKVRPHGISPIPFDAQKKPDSAGNEIFFITFSAGKKSSRAKRPRTLFFIDQPFLKYKGNAFLAAVLNRLRNLILNIKSIVHQIIR